MTPPLSASPFLLLDDPAAFRDPAALVVRIPHGIRSKQKLLGIYAERLHLPGYFGWNWDALEECLRDLSWLPEEQAVAIVHTDLPFGQGGTNRAAYLGLLADAVHHWRASGRDRLRVVFPALPGEARSS